MNILKDKRMKIKNDMQITHTKLTAKFKLFIKRVKAFTDFAAKRNLRMKQAYLLNMWDFDSIPLITFEACLIDGKMDHIFIDRTKKMKVNDIVLIHFTDIYYQYLSDTNSDKEFTTIYKKYVYHFVKNMILSIAKIMIERDKLTESMKGILLKRYAVTRPIIGIIEGAIQGNKLQLSKAQKTLDEYNNKNKQENNKKARLTDNVGIFTEVLNYHIPLSELTLLQYCNYLKLVENKISKQKKVNNGRKYK